jgi:hypothetical protein
LLLLFGVANLPRLATVPFDARVLLFAFGALVLSVTTIGLLPAWKLASGDLLILLNERARSGTLGRNTMRWMLAPVVTEIAIAVVLTARAGWMVQSFSRLNAIDPGFVNARLLSGYGD